MPNMSYCRFENTAGDLYECVEVMRDVWSGNKRVLYLNDTERSSFYYMANLCREFLEMHDWIVGADLITDDYSDPRLRDDEY